MRLGCALVASDLNPRYLSFYPLVRRVWREVVGVPAKLALIADAIPPALAEHAEDILLVPPIPGVHSAFLAQCVRLVYPALLTDAGGAAVMVSDIDMIPMNRAYYTDSLSAHADDCFVILRANVLMAEAHQIAICYNAAAPSTWSSVMGGIRDETDARDRLLAWARADYDGVHGGVGWNTDQSLLYDHVTAWGRGAGTGRVVALTDADTGYRRLDRIDMELDGGLIERDHADALAGRFTDCHMMCPPGRYAAFNEAVAALPRRMTAPR